MKKLFFAFLLFSNFADAQIINTYAGNGTVGYSGDGGLKTLAAISIAGGLAKDTSGNIYIGGFSNNTIRKVMPSGIITTYAGNGMGGYSGDGGQATNASLSGPVKIAMDAAGNLYVAEQYNHIIRKISSSGIISTVAGSGFSGSSGDGGAATAARLSQPTGVCIDPAGNIYVADLGNNKIRKISTTGIISTIAGTGAAGSSGDGGPATAATINSPFGVDLDAAGNLFIAEPGSHRIRKINTAGIISTFAGTGTPGFSGDGGAATAAKLYNPGGVLPDTSGNVYVADQLNNRIRKISPTGIITTMVGTGVLGFSGDGGPATAAKLSGSNEMLFDNYGNLLITDNENYRVRIISFCSPGAITHQPINDTEIVGGDAKYYVATTMPSPVYQWQANSGAGFVNLTSVLPYIGVNTDTLTIQNVIMLYNATHYRCIISNGTSCTDTTAGPILIVQDKTGLQQFAQGDVNIYPNPAQDNIVVELSFQNPQGNIELINQLGQTIANQEIKSNATNLSLSGLPQGMYILKIESEGQVIFRKLVKK